MQRNSDRHGPQQDDALKRETEPLERAGQDPRAEEWRQAEPPADDDFDVDRVPDGTRSGGTPPGVTSEDVTGRAELARWLGPASFPAVGAALVAEATGHDAPDHVLRAMRRLPDDQRFDNIQEVWSQLGGGSESPERPA